MADTAETGTALALFPKLNLPSVTGITEEMNKSFGTMYTRIEEEIAALPSDMSIKANRELVASTAYKISRTKTGLDEAAAGVSSDAKAIVDAVNSERRQLKNTLDILRDKARAPLDAWEEAEASKKARAEITIAGFQDVAREHAGKDSGELALLLSNLSAWQFKEETYGERVDDVKAAHAIATERLAEMHETRVKYEQEQIELEQLRREKAEREATEAARKAEEERKAAEAAEAKRQEEERARIAKEAEEKAARDAAEAIEAAKREQAAAEQRAKDAEEREKQRVEQARRAEIEAQEQQKMAAARAEEEATRREEQAKQDERDRIERERLAKEKADRERAADLAHRRKINGEAAAGLMKACGLSDKDAQAVVVAIYKEQVPHVAISY